MQLISRTLMATTTGIKNNIISKATLIFQCGLSLIYAQKGFYDGKMKS